MFARSRMNRWLTLATLTGLCALTGASFAAGESQGHGDGKAEAGAKDAANAMKAIKADAGLKVELWASDPQFANAVAFAPDDKGRWFVTETYRQEGRQVNG